MDVCRATLELPIQCGGSSGSAVAAPLASLVPWTAIVRGQPLREEEARAAKQRLGWWQV